MSFARLDSLDSLDGLDARPGLVMVGAHLLEVSAGERSPSWELRCGSCLFLLAAAEFGPDLLGGVLAVPSIAGHPPVSWVWGSLPDREAAEVEILVGRGWRRPALTSAHHLADGGWGAAAPGPARGAIVATRSLPPPGVVSDSQVARRLPEQPCEQLRERKA